MKWGTLYGPHYVNRLYGMTTRHPSLPFRFVCLTDDTSSLRQETREVSDGLNVDPDTGSEVMGFDIDHASSRFDQSTLETEALPLLRSTKSVDSEHGTNGASDFGYCDEHTPR